MRFRLCRHAVAAVVATAGLTVVPRLAVGQAAGAGPTYPGRYPFTAADIRFVTGMISHHAQAIIMAKWAPTHGASKSVGIMCERIINAQADEIVLMQNWLKDRKQPVPEATPLPMKMMMGGMEHEMMMPGMLTEGQMQQLDASKGTDFDRYFLMFMIQHHRGALTMVDEMFASPGAGQDEFVFKFASDVFADQGSEIDRLGRMLSPLILQGKP